MRIGEWQDEKPTEPGMWFTLYGDVEVRENISYLDLARCLDGSLYDRETDQPVEDFDSRFQWAKVYIGLEAKEDPLYDLPGDPDIGELLDKITIKG